MIGHCGDQIDMASGHSETEAQEVDGGSATTGGYYKELDIGNNQIVGVNVTASNFRLGVMAAVFVEYGVSSSSSSLSSSSSSLSSSSSSLSSPSSSSSSGSSSSSSGSSSSASSSSSSSSSESSSSSSSSESCSSSSSLSSYERLFRDTEYRDWFTTGDREFDSFSSSSSSLSSSSSSLSSSSSSSSWSGESSSSSSSSELSSSSSSSESSSSSSGSATISESFDGKEFHFLVTLNCDGLIKRYSHSRIHVPNADGDDLFFGNEDLILNDFAVGSYFDIRSWTYNVQNVSIVISNTGRLQDEEKLRRLEGGLCTIHLWCEGMDWTEVDPEFLVLQGVFSKDWHDAYQYAFTLVSEAQSRFKTLPGITINENSWSGMRTEGGAGSVAGQETPIIYGTFTKGIPLYCIDTAAYKYAACLGPVDCLDADYGTDYFVYDMDGNIIADIDYTFYPGGVDGEGNVVAYFDFIDDQVDNEPLSCSICGFADGSGEITGTAGATIEHPADIYYHLMWHYSDISSRDIQSLRTMKAILPGLKYAMIINASAEGDSVVDRILSECFCARLVRPGGGMGVVTFNPFGVILGKIVRDIDMIGDVVISATPDTLVTNNLEVEYKFNPATNTYEGNFKKNSTNNADCKFSYFQYGERPLIKLQLRDVHTQAMAEYLVDRYLMARAFRHDIVACSVPIWKGLEMYEGDCYNLTVQEGPSRDGNGYVEEKAILLDRMITKDRIDQNWWIVSAK